MRKYTKIQTALVTSAVWMIGVAGGLYYAQSSFIIKNPSDQVVVYRASRDINIGDTLSSDNIETVYVDASDVVEGSVLDLESLKSKKAVTKITAHEQINENRLVDSSLDVNSNSVIYSIPINNSNTSAYSVNVGEYVCVMVKYKDSKPSQPVIPKIALYDLKSSDGVSVKTDPTIKPAYALILVTNPDSSESLKQLQYLDDASKQGDLYLAKYLDHDASVIESSYQPSWEQEVVSRGLGLFE